MIFIHGGKGYVGQAFCDLLKGKGIDFRSISREELNYADEATLTAALKNEQPDFLINCAGYTGKPNVDACETDKANCVAGNAVLPGVIDAACGEAGVPWGHVSSGCSFSGNTPDSSGFSETSIPNFSFRTNNCSFYSGTKALGEEALGYSAQNAQWLHASTPSCYIWRLRIPFNQEESPRNYLTKLMRYPTLLEAENSISQLQEFVSACFATWEKRLPLGIYNVTNPGSVHTSDVVELIKKAGVQLEQSTGTNPFPTDYKFFTDNDEFMTKAAKTPRSNCVMNTDKLQAAGIKLTPVNEAIMDALLSWKPEAQVAATV